MEDIQGLVGANIRYYRRLRSITQESLAEMVDVSSPYIGYLERGQKSPSLDLLGRIAKALEVEPASLFMPMDEIDTQLKQLIALLSDKPSSTTAFVLDVAKAYFKSLGKKTGKQSKYP